MDAKGVMSNARDETTARSLLRDHQAHCLKYVEALDFYDGLGPASLEMMQGIWKGSGLHSGHPFDGSLERFGWFGKRFDSSENVYPLLFSSRSDGLIAVDPRFLPFDLAMRLGLTQSRTAARTFRAACPALRTRQPSARLRMAEFRGVVSASMIYDRMPIIDFFRRVDDDTAVGAMDYRGFRTTFFFVLERCAQ